MCSDSVRSEVGYIPNIIALKKNYSSGYYVGYRYIPPILLINYKVLTSYILAAQHRAEVTYAYISYKLTPHLTGQVDLSWFNSIHGHLQYVQVLPCKLGAAVFKSTYISSWDDTYELDTSSCMHRSTVSWLIQLNISSWYFIRTHLFFVRLHTWTTTQTAHHSRSLVGKRWWILLSRYQFVICNHDAALAINAAAGHWMRAREEHACLTDVHIWLYVPTSYEFCKLMRVTSNPCEKTQNLKNTIIITMSVTNSDYEPIAWQQRCWVSIIAIVSSEQLLVGNYNRTERSQLDWKHRSNYRK